MSAGSPRLSCLFTKPYKASACTSRLLSIRRRSCRKTFLDSRMSETGAKHLVKKKKAFCALGVMIFFGASLLLFIVIVDEQSVISSGSAAAERIRLQDLITRNFKTNQHVELLDFYFGKQYIYAT